MDATTQGERLDLAEVPRIDHELEAAFRRRVGLWRLGLRNDSTLGAEVAKSCEEEILELLFMGGESSPIDRTRAFLGTLREFLRRPLPAPVSSASVSVPVSAGTDTVSRQVGILKGLETTGRSPRRRWIGRKELARRLSISPSAVGNILAARGLEEIEVRREKGAYLEELEEIARRCGGKEASFVRPGEADKILGGRGRAAKAAAKGLLRTVKLAGLSVPLYVRDQAERLRRVQGDGMPLFGQGGN